MIPFPSGDNVSLTPSCKLWQYWLKCGGCEKLNGSSHICHGPMSYQGNYMQ